MALDARYNLRISKDVADKYVRAADLVGTQAVDLMRAILSEYADVVLSSSEAAALMRRGDVAGASVMFQQLALEASQRDAELRGKVGVVVSSEGQ